MAYVGVITDSGRILRAKQVMSAITHVAVGTGDPSWDPNNPPQPDPSQTGLINEVARKESYKKTFLIEDPTGSLAIAEDPDNPSLVRYFAETNQETNIIAIFFRFEEWEAVDVAIQEYGFFGDGVQYVNGGTAYAEGGVYDPVNNPNGQVLYPGKLYRVVNVPKKVKTSSDSIEFVFFERF